MRLHLLLEFARPFFVAEEIRESIVVTAEAEVGPAHQRGMSRKCYLHRRRRAARVGYVDIDLESAAQVQEESVVSNRQAGPKRRIPNVAKSFLSIRTVGRDLVRVSR